MLELRRLAPVLLTALALGVAACGEEEEEQPAATAPPAETQPTETQSADTGTGEVSKNLDEKPAIPKPSGQPPSELQKEDIVKGKGKTARSGDNVSMQYVGVNFSNGAEFDASWNRGQPFEFTLGASQVIPGWDQGIEGMKEGGRRMLVIPPELGYGPQGTPDGSIPPNETLVFVVDLEKVTRGGG